MTNSRRGSGLQINLSQLHCSGDLEGISTFSKKNRSGQRFKKNWEKAEDLGICGQQKLQPDVKAGTCPRSISLCQGRPNRKPEEMPGTCPPYLPDQVAVK
jgi:hypothetical protein